jgi:hypothetical protein
MQKYAKRLAANKGDSYIGVVIFIMIMMIMLVFILNVAPIFLTKMQLNNYANELCREAEIAGRVGTETTARLDRLNESSGMSPTVVWSETGKIQIGRTFTVTVSADVDFSFFIFSGNTITISSTAEGTSEVFWKS